MCQLYAKQLADQGDIRKAVSYLLICGQSSEALELLNSNQLYREATAVTRCLYADDSAEVRQSLSRWAGKALADCNVELAAKCMIGSGEVGDAARTLARRLDPASLRLSADLANSAGLDQLASAYLKQADELELSEITASENAALETNSASIQDSKVDSEKQATEDLAESLQDLAVKNDTEESTPV